MAYELTQNSDVWAHLAVAANSGSWKAGVAKADITPREALWLVGGPRDKAYSETLSPLWVRALALGDSYGTRAVILSVETLHLTAATSNAVAAELFQSHGLARSAVMCCATDTHNSPMIAGSLHGLFDLKADEWDALERYRKKLEETMIKVARAALDSMEPALLFRGNGKARFGVNRRKNVEADVARMLVEGRELQGPVDHDVPVLSVTDPQGRPRAAAFGYACQNSSLSKAPAFHGDYAGVAQAELEQRHRGMTALFFMGCGADVNALPRGTLELTQEYGRQLATAVDDTLSGTTMSPLPGPLRTAYGIVDLPFAHVPTREELTADLTRNLGDGYDAFAQRTARHLLKRLDAEGEIPATYPYPIQLWRFGRELLWIALGGEVVVDYSKLLKGQFGASSTWVGGYVNDVMGYIPSTRVAAEGGYEGGLAAMVYGQPAPWWQGIEGMVMGKIEWLVYRMR